MHVSERIKETTLVASERSKMRNDQRKGIFTKLFISLFQKIKFKFKLIDPSFFKRKKKRPRFWH
jgi:hypothetical protein